jgi:hypothetical protein
LHQQAAELLKAVSAFKLASQYGGRRNLHTFGSKLEGADATGEGVAGAAGRDGEGRRVGAAQRLGTGVNARLSALSAAHLKRSALDMPRSPAPRTAARG